MDSNTKEVLLAALGLLSTLGGAYIAARWHVSVKTKNPPPDMRDTSTGDPGQKQVTPPGDKP